MTLSDAGPYVAILLSITMAIGVIALVIEQLNDRIKLMRGEKKPDEGGKEGE